MGVPVFSPGSSQTLATSSHVWDIASGAEVRTYPEHSVRAYSADQRVVVALGPGKRIDVLDSESAKPIHTFTVDSFFEQSLSLSPDGRLLAGVAGEKKIAIWDVTTGQTLRTLTARSGIRVIQFDRRRRRARVRRRRGNDRTLGDGNGAPPADLAWEQGRDQHHRVQSRRPMACQWWRRWHRPHLATQSDILNSEFGIRGANAAFRTPHSAFRIPHFSCYSRVVAEDPHRSRHRTRQRRPGARARTAALCRHGRDEDLRLAHARRRRPLVRQQRHCSRQHRREESAQSRAPGRTLAMAARRPQLRPRLPGASAGQSRGLRRALHRG